MWLIKDLTNIWIVYLWLAILTYLYVSFSKTCSTYSTFIDWENVFPLGLLFSHIKPFLSP